MLRHYFVTAVRYFLKQKTYSGINALGLAVGLASVILITLWIREELSFDGFHANKNDIYQIYENQTYDGGTVYTFASTPGVLSEYLKKENPEIRESVRVTWPDRLLFQANNKNIFETGVWADPALFSVFTFPVIEGDIRKVLSDNSSIAISARVAKAFFGNESPIGKTFVISNRIDAKVTAVFENIPENSSLQFEYVLPFDKYLAENSWLNEWGNNGIQTFLQLQPGSDYQALAARIKGVVKKNSEGSVVDLLINPISKWYLYKYEKGVQTDGRILIVRVFAAVAVFILVIACINFMNLATARATLRMKEVGIRKVSGAQRGAIMGQFLGESILTAMLALVLAIVLAALVLPLFNELVEKHIVIPFTSPWFIAGLILSAVITGLLAGSYPAFYLSAFQPAHVLKGKLETGGNFSLRKGLVVFQFFLSIVLIICSLTIGRQIDYLRNKDLGFDHANVVTFGLSKQLAENFDAFRNSLLSQQGVVSIGRANCQPYSIGSSTGGVDWDGKPKDATILFQVALCDNSFFPTTNMKFVEGRNFMPNNAADSSNFIVTEEAVKLMNMTEPVGRRLRWNGKEGQIIGVLKDFHAWNLRFGMQPVVFGLSPKESPNVFVKIAGQNQDEIVKQMEATWKKFEANYPFEFNFMDQQVDQIYRSEKSIGRLSAVFTFMAILISCMGLFALASFTAERRTKEIGIRKVLGATSAGIVVSLCRNFLALVIIAIVVGAPLAWYLMKTFLDTYAYHTELELVVFIVAAACLLFIALGTVTWQSLKAASVNPATSLRSE